MDQGGVYVNMHERGCSKEVLWAFLVGSGGGAYKYPRNGDVNLTSEFPHR